MANKKNLAVQSQKPQKNRKARIAVIVTLSVVLVALITLGVVLIARNVSEHSENKKVVALCNGFEIPYEELRFLTKLYKDEMAYEYGETIWDDPATAEQHRAELERRVWENLPENYVILSTCRHLGIDTDSKTMRNYIKDYVQETKNSLGGNAEYKKFLEEQGMSESHFRFQMGISYLESVIYYTLNDNGIYAYTQENIGDFIDHVMESDEYVRTIHVYIENKEGESMDDRMARAQAITDDLRSITDNEDRLAAMHAYIGSAVNDDLYSVSLDGSYFTRGEMDQPYEDASFGLELYGVSDPVQSSGGVFVLMRLPLEEDYVTRNCGQMLEYWQAVKMGLYMDQFRESCTIDLTEYGKSIDLVAMK